MLIPVLDDVALLGTRDDNVYAGTRVRARVKLTDPWTYEAVPYLALSITFTEPGGTEHDAGTMEPIETGIYEGSYVVNQAGEWTVEIEAPTPYEAVWRHSFYVSER
jgi:nitrogen fixation protein FixH